MARPTKYFEIRPLMGHGGAPPRYNGDIALWPEYEARAKGYAAGQKDEFLALVGPELYNELYDTAWARVKDLDPTTFRGTGGHLRLLDLLRPDFSKYPHSQAGEAVDELFYGLARLRSEDAMSYVPRFNTGLSKMLTQVRQEEDREATKDFNQARTDYSIKMVEFRQASTEYNEEVTRRLLNQEEPEEPPDLADLVQPVRPVAPAKPPSSTFTLPSSISGRLFLRKFGYSREQRAHVYRTVGSWKLQDLQECVKMSDQEHATVVPHVTINLFQRCDFSNWRTLMIQMG